MSVVGRRSEFPVLGHELTGLGPAQVAHPQAGRHDRLRERRPGACRSAPCGFGQRSGAGAVIGRWPAAACADWRWRRSLPIDPLIANLDLGWRFTGVRVASAPALDDYIFSNAETIRQRLDLPRTYAPENFDIVETLRRAQRSTARCGARLDHRPHGRPRLRTGHLWLAVDGPATSAVLEAARLAARSDGLMVDPNYTGVALAGLIDRIEDGAGGRLPTRLVVIGSRGGHRGESEVDASARVPVSGGEPRAHAQVRCAGGVVCEDRLRTTGGTPAIFSYAEELVPAETLAVTP